MKESVEAEARPHTEVAMYEADLAEMSLDGIVEVLNGLRYRYESSPWRDEDVELVAAIRSELIHRGYPASRVDLVCTFPKRLAASQRLIPGGR